MRKNKKCCKIQIDAKTLLRMENQARTRDAPVFRVEKVTHGDPFRTLVFVILSARTRDEQTLKVTERLFSFADTPTEIFRFSTKPKRLEKLLRGIGFYNVKARNLLETCRMIIAKNGKVPETLDGLLELPGVGRKTANIVLASAFGKDTIGVDTHMHQISNRLGLVRTKGLVETEKRLMKRVPKRFWGKLNLVFVAFGKMICTARNPKCRECVINKACPKVGVSIK